VNRVVVLCTVQHVDEKSVRNIAVFDSETLRRLLDWTIGYTRCTRYDDTQRYVPVDSNVWNR